MIVRDEQEMVALGEKLAEDFDAPLTVELIGDVGAGKTTLVKGIARGLGVAEEITSPSFTVSKSYRSEKRRIGLVHFDFYRLTDPGIMEEELSEATKERDMVTVVEWAETVADILPRERVQITIGYNDDGTRSVEVEE